MKRFITSILLFAFLIPTYAEENPVPKTSSKEGEAKNSERPLPATLDEAHAELEKLPPEILAEIDAMKSEDEMIKYHLDLGMGIRNSWGLWGGGPLAKHMKELGFTHPDDMSGVILETFWCKRHKKDFRLEERAAFYKAFWLASKRPPETIKDPSDGSDIEWNWSVGVGDQTTPRLIHLGKSKKTGRQLVYEYDKGVYVPVDKEVLDAIKQVEAR